VFDSRIRHDRKLREMLLYSTFKVFDFHRWRCHESNQEKIVWDYLKWPLTEKHSNKYFNCVRESKHSWNWPFTIKWSAEHASQSDLRVSIILLSPALNRVQYSPVRILFACASSDVFSLPHDFSPERDNEV